MRFSIVIATYNRAGDLRDTLGSLAGLTPDWPWEVIVVDNNSRDETPRVVAEAARTFPVELRYIFEEEQGRSAALNAGIRAARGEIIVTTDDDVRVASDWLDRVAAGLDRLGCDYVGGKVLPIWGGEQPHWLPSRGGRHYSRVLALLDFGPEPVEFGKRVPLGVNMAFRREAFERAGWWSNRVGRKAGTLLGQEVREWVLRAQAAGLRGFYVPDMVVNHLIPRDRLNKRYFRRWFYWNGISRAMLFERSSLALDARKKAAERKGSEARLAGIPRYMYRKTLRALLAFAWASARLDRAAAFEHELWLWFFAGVVKQLRKDRGWRARQMATPAEL